MNSIGFERFARFIQSGKTWIQDHPWSRIAAKMIVVFCAAYIFTTLALQPSVQYHFYRLIPVYKLIPQKYRSKAFKLPEENIRIANPVTLPKVYSRSGSVFNWPDEKLILITSFSSACRFASKSVPFWKRLNESLPKDKVTYAFIICSKSAEDIERFIQTTELDSNIYFNTCDQIEPIFMMQGGIAHCLIGKNGARLAVWRGMPLNAKSEAQMADEISDEIQKAL